MKAVGHEKSPFETAMVGGGPLLEDRLNKDGHVSVGRPKSSHNGETEVVLAPSDNGVKNKARV